MDVNALSEQIRLPDTTEMMEVECVMVGEEEKSILLRVSVPVDVLRHKGDVKETMTVTVNESSVSDWKDRENAKV